MSFNAGILNAHLDQLVTVSLRGYIFFGAYGLAELVLRNGHQYKKLHILSCWLVAEWSGSAVKILADITEHVLSRHIDTNTSESVGGKGSNHRLDLPRPPARASRAISMSSTGSNGSDNAQPPSFSGTWAAGMSQSFGLDDDGFLRQPMSLSLITPGE